jgi:hypothetical protein
MMTKEILSSVTTEVNMAIKNIAGQPVRGENFFDRPALVREFRQKISRGGSINSRY